MENFIQHLKKQLQGLKDFFLNDLIVNDLLEKNV